MESRGDVVFDLARKYIMLQKMFLRLTTLYFQHRWCDLIHIVDR